jgi:hypothetical protein
MQCNKLEVHQKMKKSQNPKTKIIKLVNVRRVPKSGNKIMTVPV